MLLFMHNIAVKVIKNSTLKITSKLEVTALKSSVRRSIIKLRLVDAEQRYNANIAELRTHIDA